MVLSSSTRARCPAALHTTELRPPLRLLPPSPPLQLAALRFPLLLLRRATTLAPSLLAVPPARLCPAANSSPRALLATRVPPQPSARPLPLAACLRAAALPQSRPCSPRLAPAAPCLPQARAPPPPRSLTPPPQPTTGSPTATVRLARERSLELHHPRELPWPESACRRSLEPPD
nr:lysine-rich arabinogalactan protein 19-like [Aegilops tauschii subsp. strangulata]